MQARPTVAIVGAGFSGSMLALHLLEAGPPDLRITLIERSAGFGPGLAFGTHNPHHLLNVRVGNMSAFPDRPRHLEHWLATHARAESANPAAFISRGTYGRYLASLLRNAVRGLDGARRLILVHDEAVDLQRSQDGVRLTLAMGRRLELDVVVLAVGNSPPPPPPGVALETVPTAVYAPDPWAKDALADLDNAAPVLLIGTGLTMVDIAVALDAHGHHGRILALSRRGLTPRTHSGFAMVPRTTMVIGDVALSGRARQLRRRAAVVGWRAAIDELRPATQAIWREADLTQRRRFLRHLRPWWDVHRHRMAPAVADRIAAMRRDGRLATAAGRIVRVEPDGLGASVIWRPRGAGHEETFRVGRIINCTGLGGDPARASNPLIRGLIERGEARADALALGLEVDEDCQVVDASGHADARLRAIGPITRGSFWESIAVPDIRNQIADLADHLGAQFRAAMSDGPGPLRGSGRPRRS
jgi:uncharacterized NAD(P)/FAD-binding protein YdhS